MNRYEIDTQVQVNVTFLAVSINVPPVPADPSGVALFISDPDGNETQVGYDPGPVQRTGIGLYFYTFVPSGPGEWTYKWQGTGNVIATSRDTRFFVKASSLIDD
jgi:hypothetical protein